MVLIGPARRGLDNCRQWGGMVPLLQPTRHPVLAGNGAKPARFKLARTAAERL